MHATAIGFRRIKVLGKPFLVLDSVRDRSGALFLAIISEADFDHVAEQAEAGVVPEPKLLWVEQRGEMAHPVGEEQVKVLDAVMTERVLETLALMTEEGN